MLNKIKKTIKAAFIIGTVLAGNSVFATDSGTYTNPILGAINQTQSTADGGANAGSYVINASSDFSCSSKITVDNPKRLALRGVRVLITSCDKAAPIQVQTCYKGMKSSSSCPNVSDYTTSATVTANGSFVSDGTLQYGIGCEDNSTFCRLTARGTYNFSVSSTDLDNVKTSDSQVIAGINNNNTVGNMRDYKQSAGAFFKDCMDKNGAATDGNFTSCDGTKSVTVDLSKKNSTSTNCSTEKKCLAMSDVTTTTDKQCDTSFEWTTQTQTFTTSTKQCKWTSNKVLNASSLTYSDVAGSIGLTTNVSEDLLAWYWFKCQYGTTSQSFYCYIYQAWKNRAYPNFDINEYILRNNGACEDGTQPSSDQLNSATGSVQCIESQTPDNSIGINGWGTGLDANCKNAAYVKNVDVFDPTKAISTPSYASQITGTCDASILADTAVGTCSEGWYGRTLDGLSCSSTKYNSNWGMNVTYELDESQKAGCGYCKGGLIKSLCYTGVQTSSCTSAGIDNCKFVSSVPIDYTGDGAGIVTTQKSNYSCSKTTQQCTSWTAPSDSAQCSSISAAADYMGEPQTTGLNASFNQAVQVTAVAKELSKAVVSSDNPDIELFKGRALTCTRPANMAGQVTQQNCCKLGMTKPQNSQLTRDGCDEDAVELSVARGKNMAVYLGEQCTAHITFMGKNIGCRETSQKYCVFDNVFTSTIQKQGRQQLADAVSSASKNQVVNTIQYNYYADSNAGSWATAPDSNGVKTAFWQWPKICSNATEAAKLVPSTETASCSGQMFTWVASCIKDSCAALPVFPEKGSEDWKLIKIDPLNMQTGVAQPYAVSAYSTVKGACTTAGVCTYDLTTVPSSSGGRLISNQSLNWNLYSAVQTANGTTVTEEEYKQSCLKIYSADKCPPNKPMPEAYKSANARGLIIGGIHIKPVPVTTNSGTLPASIDLNYSADNGATWKTFSVPTNGSEVSFVYDADGNTATLKGYCVQASGACSYRVTVTSTITAKPWGSYDNPDCSGFTLTQMSALNFDKMDMTEFKASISQSVNDSLANNTTLNGSNAQATADSLKNNQLTNTATNSVLSSDKFAILSKTSGVGPFLSTLKFPKKWPNAIKPTDSVVSATVDWGDCKGPISVNPGSDGVFVVTKSVESVPDAWSNCGQGKKYDDYTYNIVLTVNLSTNGTKKYQLSIVNGWEYPSKDGVGIAAEATTATGTTRGNASYLSTPGTQ